MTRSAVPAETTVQLPPLQLRAEVRANSVNASQRTVDLVFSTGAPVRRFDWMRDEVYYETLSLDPAHVRLDRLNTGAPFLNAHSSYAIEDVLGVVVEGSARIADGEGTATVRFSKRANVDSIWQDVRDKILRNVSVGYIVHRYEETQATKDAPKVRHAVDWEPYEISAVPIGADAGAQMRDAKTPTHPCVIVRAAPAQVSAPKELSMDPETQVAEQVDDTTDAAAEIVRTELDAATDAERERINGILSGCEAIKLSMRFARKLIDDKLPLVKAQTLILDEAKKRSGDADGPRPGPSGIKFVGADPIERFLQGVTGAILHRVEPNWFPLDENSKQYRGKSVLRLAEDVLRERGQVDVRNLSRLQIAGYALGLESRAAGFHTTSDFPLILDDVANKTLRRAYEVAPQTWLPISRQISLPDFKPIKRNQFGEAPALLKVLEHGEFTRGTVAEGKEQFQLATYGRIFGVTRQAIVNDDLDAFSRLTVGFGRSARNLESDVVWYQILKNAAMGDGVVLFDAADHANYTTPGTAITVDNLGVGFAAMQTQKATDNVTYLNLSPRYLIVPPAKITVAMQYTTVVNPNISSSVNPWSGILQPISEPRLQGGVTLDNDTVAGSSTAWYLAATPDQVDVIEYGYLEGQSGPAVETRVGWEIDAFEIKCRHDFAAKVIDHRGLYKNAGA